MSSRRWQCPLPVSAHAYARQRPLLGACMYVRLVASAASATTHPVFSRPFRRSLLYAFSIFQYFCTLQCVCVCGGVCVCVSPISGDSPPPPLPPSAFIMANAWHTAYVPTPTSWTALDIVSTGRHSNDYLARTVHPRDNPRLPPPALPSAFDPANIPHNLLAPHVVLQHLAEVSAPRVSAPHDGCPWRCGQHPDPYRPQYCQSTMIIQTDAGQVLLTSPEVIQLSQDLRTRHRHNPLHHLNAYGYSYGRDGFLVIHATGRDENLPYLSCIHCPGRRIALSGHRFHIFSYEHLYNIYVAIAGDGEQIPRLTDGQIGVAAAKFMDLQQTQAAHLTDILRSHDPAFPAFNRARIIHAEALNAVMGFPYRMRAAAVSRRDLLERMRADFVRSARALNDVQRTVPANERRHLLFQPDEILEVAASLNMLHLELPIDTQVKLAGLFRLSRAVNGALLPQPVPNPDFDHHNFHEDRMVGAQEDYHGFDPYNNRPFHPILHAMDEAHLLDTASAAAAAAETRHPPNDRGAADDARAYAYRIIRDAEHEFFRRRNPEEAEARDAMRAYFDHAYNPVAAVTMDGL